MRGSAHEENEDRHKFYKRSQETVSKLTLKLELVLRHVINDHLDRLLRVFRHGVEGEQRSCVLVTCTLDRMASNQFLISIVIDPVYSLPALSQP